MVSEFIVGLYINDKNRTIHTNGGRVYTVFSYI